MRVVQHIVQHQDDVVKRQHDEHVQHIVIVNQVEQHVVQYQGHQHVRLIEHGVVPHIVIVVVVVDVVHHVDE